MPHDFQRCLAASHAAEELPIWEEVYNKAFAGIAAIVSHRRDGFWQREGIDRSLTLETGKQILIDEKVRGRNAITGRVYDDIALEWLSNDQTNAPGWVCKPLRADYIAYLIAPLGVCYLLPVLQLQNAWAQHGESWKKAHKNVVAENYGYRTLSTAVPTVAVFKAMGQELRVRFDPFELDAAA